MDDTPYTDGQAFDASPVGGAEAITDGTRRYACGFLFSGEAQSPEVLLIRKARPVWQAGKLNGIGGSVEPGEDALQAMVREFREEACLDVEDWTLAAVLHGPDFEVSFFFAWAASEFFASARAGTDEQLERHPAWDVRQIETVPNLRFLIPLCLDQSGIVLPLVLEDRFGQ